jgi:hypothetical protein
LIKTEELEESIAQHHPYYTGVRFHPHAVVYLIAIAPAVNHEFAVLVEMTFVHSQSSPCRKIIVKQQRWRLIRRKLGTKEETVVDAYETKLILTGLDYQTTTTVGRSRVFYKKILTRSVIPVFACMTSPPVTELYLPYITIKVQPLLRHVFLLGYGMDLTSTLVLK